MSEEMKKKIKEQISNSPIMVYIKGEKEMPMCGFSKTVVDILKIMDVPFETFNILEDWEFLQTLKEYSNWNTTPQLYIDGKFIGGCDITMELYKSGELKQLLDSALNKEKQVS